MRQHGTGTIHKFKIKDSASLDEAGNPKQAAIAIAKKKAKKSESYDPLAAFENFIDTIVSEDEDQGEDTLFSPNKDTQKQAIEKLNKILATELKGGPDGINAIESLKGIIDDPELIQQFKETDPDLDTRPLIQQFIHDNDPDLLSQIHFGEDKVGGQDLETPPPAPEAPPAPDLGAAPPAPEAPAAPAPAPDLGAAPPQPAPGEGLPPAPPVAENVDAKAKLKAKLIRAKEHGATLETVMDFGHKEMTLHDAMRECGISPMECGYGDDTGEDGVHQMMKSISGFWNKEANNFTIGGTRAKTKVVKDFKDGEFPNATEEDLRHVLHMIDQMDPSEHGSDELGHIRHLAGLGHQHQ
jgi:hypothetical protein